MIGKNDDGRSRSSLKSKEQRIAFSTRIPWKILDAKSDKKKKKLKRATTISKRRRGGQGNASQQWKPRKSLATTRKTVDRNRKRRAKERCQSEQ
jgi:hypothetical protein